MLQLCSLVANPPIAEPKALKLEKDHLAEPWNVGSFRKYPVLLVVGLTAFTKKMQEL